MLNKSQKLKRKTPLTTGLEVNASPGALALREEVEIEEAEFADSLPGERAGFVSSRDRIRKLTTDFKSFCHCNEADKQLALLGQMQEQIKSIRGAFVGAELALWVKLCSSISTLLFATAKKPGFLTFSSPRTIADALGLLKEVVVSGPRSRALESSPLKVVVVDYDTDERRALATALANQGLKVTECDSLAQAQHSLQENTFDLMLSDAELAGLEDLAESPETQEFLEELPFPVIFSVRRMARPAPEVGDLAEGCDFIAKPFAPTEVVVKVISVALQYRLEFEEKPAPARSSSAAMEAQSKRAALPPMGLTTALAELTRERELRAGAEQALSELRNSHEKLQQELSHSGTRPQQLQTRIATLEEKLQTLLAESEESMHREAQSSQLNQALEEQLRTLGRTLSQTRQELAEENERRLAAELIASQLAQNRAKLEHELALNVTQPRKADERATALEKAQESLANELDAVMRRETKLQRELSNRTQQFQQAQENLAELEKKQQSLNGELRGALQRETRFKKQISEIEKRLETLNDTLRQTRTQLEQESDKRASAEQQATQAARKLQDVTKKEQSVRNQLEQVAKEHATALADAQAALRKEASLRQAAERSVSELTSIQARLEKKLADSAAQTAKAEERIEALEAFQKSVQTELRELLERRKQLHQQSAALDHEFDALSRSLRQG